MTRERIIKLAKDIIKVPKEFGEKLPIAVETIQDLHMLTEEMHKLGFDCMFDFNVTYEFGANSIFGANIMFNKIKKPMPPKQKNPPAKTQQGSESSPPNR